MRYRNGHSGERAYAIATRCEIEATTHVPGYRATVFSGRAQLASAHFRATARVYGGTPCATQAALDSAYRKAKYWLAGYGLA